MVYKFNDTQDFVRLAMFIQSKVYWGSRFHFEDDDSESIPYRDLWDIISMEIDNGTKAIHISSDDYVTFVR